MDETAIYLTKNTFQLQEMVNLSIITHRLAVLDTFSATANRSREVGEVWVGRSVAFLTAAAVPSNDLVNLIV